LNDSAALAKATIFGTHLYGTPTSGYAYPLFDSKGAGKERWMTEHYTDSTTDANSWPNALGVASELHNAMVTGQFNLYTWWYIKRSYGFINNGAVTKRGWCIAHWSKFVRPGFYRVDASAAPTAGVNVSAFKGDTDVVIVVVNTNSSSKSLAITVDGSSIASYAKYTTSASKSFADDGMVTASNGALSVTLDASSVTTLRGTGPSTGGSGGSGGSGGVAGSSGAGGNGLGGSNPMAGAGGIGGTSAVGGTGNISGSSNGVGGQSSSQGGVGTGGTAMVTTGGSGTAAGGGLQATGGDAGMGGPADEQPGCSCRTAGVSRGDWTSFSPLLLGLVGLLSRRRRARRVRA